MEKLHIAARHGQRDTLARLIAGGVNPATNNKFGCTALHLACKFGQASCARELADAAGADLGPEWHGRTPLGLAIAGDHANIVALLVAAGKAQGKDVTLGCKAYKAYAEPPAPSTRRTSPPPKTTKNRRRAAPGSADHR